MSEKRKFRMGNIHGYDRQKIETFKTRTKSSITTFICFIAFVVAVFTALVTFGASKNPTKFFDNAFIPLLAISAIAVTTWLSSEAMKGGKNGK